MSIRAILVIVLAIVCGLSAAVGISKLRQPTTAAAEVETTPVVVAAVDISRGVSVTEDAVEVRDYPKDQVPEGALTSIDQAVGRSVMIALLAGDPIRDGKLADAKAGRGISALIKPDMRAYSISTSKDASKVAGLVLPGDKVDILYTIKGTFRDETGGGSTTTLLQNVEILAIDQYVDAPSEPDPKNLNSVTLLVTPQQVTDLDLAQNTGELGLSLRNPEDDKDTHTKPSTVNGIRFAQQPVQPPIIVPVPVPQVVEVEKKAEGEQVAVAEPKERVFRIKTLRGSQSGSVSVIARTE